MEFKDGNCQWNARLMFSISSWISFHKYFNIPWENNWDRNILDIQRFICAISLRLTISIKVRKPPRSTTIKAFQWKWNAPVHSGGKLDAKLHNNLQISGTCECKYAYKISVCISRTKCHFIPLLRCMLVIKNGVTLGIYYTFWSTCSPLGICSVHINHVVSAVREITGIRRWNTNVLRMNNLILWNSAIALQHWSMVSFGHICIHRMLIGW